MATGPTGPLSWSSRTYSWSSPGGGEDLPAVNTGGPAPDASRKSNTLSGASRMPASMTGPGSRAASIEGPRDASGTPGRPCTITRDVPGTGATSRARASAVLHVRHEDLGRDLAHGDQFPSTEEPDADEPSHDPVAESEYTGFLIHDGGVHGLSREELGNLAEPIAGTFRAHTTGASLPGADRRLEHTRCVRHWCDRTRHLAGVCARGLNPSARARAAHLDGALEALAESARLGMAEVDARVHPEMECMRELDRPRAEQGRHAAAATAGRAPTMTRTSPFDRAPDGGPLPSGGFPFRGWGPSHMPFRSQAQRRWMFAVHTGMARRWAARTPAGTPPPGRARERDGSPHDRGDRA